MAGDPNFPAMYVGVHRLAFPRHLPRTMLSFNILERRRSDFEAREWILDSGAFTRITTGRGHVPVSVYAEAITRWSTCGEMKAAVAQDWMCEPFVLDLTGKTVAEHQRLSTLAFLQLRDKVPGRIYIMPVLQGYLPSDYASHTRELSSELPERCMGWRWVRL